MSVMIRYLVGTRKFVSHWKTYTQNLSSELVTISWPLLDTATEYGALSPICCPSIEFTNFPSRVNNWSLALSRSHTTRLLNLSIAIPAGKLRCRTPDSEVHILYNNTPSLLNTFTLPALWIGNIKHILMTHCIAWDCTVRITDGKQQLWAIRGQDFDCVVTPVTHHHASIRRNIQILWFLQFFVDDVFYKFVTSIVAKNRVRSNN